MRIGYLISVGMIAAFSGAAHAQQWNDVIQATNSYGTSHFPFYQTTSNLGITACTAFDQSITVFGNCGGFTASINLNQFARQGDVSSLQNQVAALAANTSAQFAALDLKLTNLAWTGSALAAAMVTVAPTDGNTNRVGINAATFGGRTAFSANYSHVSGAWDINGSVAISSAQTTYAATRVGLGFSW